MTATTASASAPGVVTRTGPWDRLLVGAAVTVILADVAVQVLARTVIPPLAIVTLLGLVGLALLTIKRRAGIAVIGGIALLWVVGSIGFSVEHLQHPESAIDFIHALIEMTGRIAIVIAAVGAWRGGQRADGARRVAVAAGAILLAGVLVGAVSTFTRSGDQAQAGDIAATVEHAEFPELAAPSGSALFIENADLFRHTFSVEGTGIDVELPARGGVRVPIDLAAGTYRVFCAVPGHEFMEATLTVR